VILQQNNNTGNYPITVLFSIVMGKFIIIIHLLKSTEQEDVHMINTRTRAGQKRHRKLALTCVFKSKGTEVILCPIMYRMWDCDNE